MFNYPAPTLPRHEKVIAGKLVGALYSFVLSLPVLTHNYFLLGWFFWGGYWCQFNDICKLFLLPCADNVLFRFCRQFQASLNSVPLDLLEK